MIGDNRENSNDSRFSDAIPADAIVGRVVARWFRMTNGAPDWAAIGVPVE